MINASRVDPHWVEGASWPLSERLPIRFNNPVGDLGHLECRKGWQDRARDQVRVLHEEGFDRIIQSIRNGGLFLLLSPLLHLLLLLSFQALPHSGRKLERILVAIGVGAYLCCNDLRQLQGLAAVKLAFTGVKVLDGDCSLFLIRLAKAGVVKDGLVCGPLQVLRQVFS